MKNACCQAPRFILFGFPLTQLFGKSRFIGSAKTFRVILAVALILMLLAPEPAQAQVQTYSCNTAFGPIPIAPVLPGLLLQSLKTVANPVLPNGPAGVVRGDLTDYIANQAAAIQLGKALFWEMQAGSDNKTACATCHFKAGA